MGIANEIIEAIKAAKKIIITAHKSPDGDSIGSSLTMQHICQKLGTPARIVHPDPAPTYLNWMSGVDQIINGEEHHEAVQSEFETADLIICLDYNEPSRTGTEMSERLIGSSAKKIMIDHHLNPSDFADLMLSDTSACSTCQLLFRLLKDSGQLKILDVDMGIPMYLGIMTDSGSFRYNSVTPETHEALAEILRVGVKQDEIHEAIYDVNSLDKIKLRARVTAEKLVLLPEYNTAYMGVSFKELTDLKYQKGDTEGLVNVALSISGVKMAAFFAENERGIKISFRSAGKLNPVNEMAAKYFNGGGHANAAGGFFEGSLEDAITKFKEVLPEYA